MENSRVIVLRRSPGLPNRLSSVRRRGGRPRTGMRRQTVRSIATGRQAIPQGPSTATVITAEDIAAMWAPARSTRRWRPPGLHVVPRRAAKLAMPRPTACAASLTSASPQIPMMVNGVPRTSLFPRQPRSRARRTAGREYLPHRSHPGARRRSMVPTPFAGTINIIITDRRANKREPASPSEAAPSAPGKAGSSAHGKHGDLCRRRPRSAPRTASAGISPPMPSRPSMRCSVPPLPGRRPESALATTALRCPGRHPAYGRLRLRAGWPRGAGSRAAPESPRPWTRPGKFEANG